jgi:hypothetical protein
MNENAAIAIGIAFLVIIYFVIKMAEAKRHCDYLFGEIDRKYPENAEFRAGTEKEE